MLIKRAFFLVIILGLSNACINQKKKPDEAGFSINNEAITMPSSLSQCVEDLCSQDAKTDNYDGYIKKGENEAKTYLDDPKYNIRSGTKTISKIFHHLLEVEKEESKSKFNLLLSYDPSKTVFLEDSVEKILTYKLASSVFMLYLKAKPIIHGISMTVDSTFWAALEDSPFKTLKPFFLYMFSNLNFVEMIDLILNYHGQATLYYTAHYNDVSNGIDHDLNLLALKLPTIEKAPPFIQEVINRANFDKIIEKVKNKAYLSEKDISVFFKFVRLIGFVADLFEEKDILKNFHLFEVIKYTYFQFDIKNKAAQFIKKINQLEPSHELELEDKFYNLYAFNIWSSPAKSDLVNFKEKIKQEIHNSLPNLKERFAQKFTDAFLKYENKILYLLPDSKEEFIDELQSKIYIKTRSENNFSTYPELTILKTITEFTDILTDDIDVIHQYSIDLMDDLTEKKLNLVDLSLFNPDHPVIMVGWQSLQSNIISATLNHELGHLILRIYDREMSTKDDAMNLKNIASCLAGKHEYNKNKIKYQRILGEDTPIGSYFNEDFADLISGTISKESYTSLGCFMIYNKKESDLNIINRNPEDSHSSNLFRALHTEYLRNGHLPASCQNYLKQLPYKFDFKSCLQKKY